MTGSRRGGAGQPVCSRRRSFIHSASAELSTADADSLRIPRRLTVSAILLPLSVADRNRNADSPCSPYAMIISPRRHSRHLSYLTDHDQLQR